LIHISPAQITAWGSAAVFANVLLTRLGAPLPVIPVLVFAGTAIASGGLSFAHVFTAAVVAALIGDGIWFTAGRKYGRKLIKVIARLSLSIDASVRTTRALFERFGTPIVAVSKFVPGLALITPPLMGSTRIAAWQFFVFDLAGTCAWASFWLLGGALFERQLGMLIHMLRPYGGTIIDVLVCIAILYPIYRVILRWRLRKWLAQVYITPEHLEELMRSDTPPPVLDARWESIRRQDPYRIQGASIFDLSALGKASDTHATQQMVVYCDCPNDAMARKVCGQLRARGYRHVHVLKGGLDAWVLRGYPTEPLPQQFSTSAVVHY
jgi:membrane protein DedA with SNARE-associated domain/rhodanese-related sulfurtransferase